MNFETIIKNQNDEIQTLKTTLHIVEKRCEQYAAAYDQMQAQLKELLRNRFGKKSERHIDDPENPQRSLFSVDETFSLAEKAGNEIEDKIQVSSHIRSNKKKSEKNIPVRIEIISVSEDEKRCSCGACKVVIRYETKQSIHHQPAIFEIVEQRREVVACEKGCDGEIITAPAPLHILPKIKATEEFLSFIVVSKLDDRQPLYHLEKQLNERHGVDCSRQTMARWTIDLMYPLQPLWNLMKDAVIEYDVAGCDATTLQVLNEPGRRAETKSYVYCIRGGPPLKSVILYEYNEKEHKKFVYDWFLDFKGYLHADGDNFFDLVGETIAMIVNCNAHARRKFEPIAQGAKGKGLAKQAMRFFKELYKIEREAKNNKLTETQRYELRQKKSKPLMEKFKCWLDEMYPTTLPQSVLGKAMAYCINRWDGLTRFLDDGRLEVDNNLTEQEIKPLVIARKNFLFCASQDGARALCMHMSFIRTAKLHGLDPYHYYVKLLKNIPRCQTVEDYEKLLPWNIKLDYASQV
jgi:transposase